MRILTSLRSIWNPALFHGTGKNNFFEGWYFKLVDRDERHRLAIIPGISSGTDPHAFIQIQDGTSSTYTRYPLSSFSSSDALFRIGTGTSSFSMNKLSLDVGSLLQGDIRITDPVPWPVTLFSPGAMGPYAFVPFMECYHGILSLNNGLDGSLIHNGQVMDFTGGRGYIEKDWGTSFPRAWIWMQSNHFDGDISVTASVAKIPWLGSSFTGFIAGIWFGGRVLRFATYTGARLTALSVDKEKVRMEFSDRRYRMQLSANRTDGGSLMSPVMGDMKGKLNESLSSLIEVSLYDRSDLLFHGTGRNSGLEVAGDMNELWPGIAH